MLSEKQKEKLEKVIGTLREKGMETFEEMILYQSALVEEAAKTLAANKNKIEKYDTSLKLNQEENKKLMEELRIVKEQCQKYAAEREYEYDQEVEFPAEGNIEPYYQKSTITFNGDPHIENIEIYYRKDR